MTYACDYSDTVDRLTMGPSDAQLRRRTGYSGGQGVFALGADVKFATGFYQTADSWAQEFSNYCAVWNGTGVPPHETDPTWQVDWWGHVGVFGHCDSSTFSWHQKGRAFDLARVRFKNGEFMDANWSWQQTIKHRRLYLAVAAMLRRNFDTVLTFGFPAHSDHIHFDNGDTLHPIDSAFQSDTLIVQMACNYMNDASLTIDGNWGSGTENAFDNLRSALGMNCFNIRSNLGQTRTFLLEVAKRGILNNPASDTGWC